MPVRTARGAARGKKKSTVMNVDFTGVESGGRTISDGWARGRIKTAEVTESSNGNPMIAMKWSATRGKETATVYDNATNTEAALWKMKMMLEALGIEVPDGGMDVDVGELPDMECDILIANEEYEGKDRPKIIEYRPLTEDGADEDDTDDGDEEENAPPARAKKKPSKRASQDDEDEEESEEEDDEEEDAEDEEEEEEEEEKPSRAKKKTAKAAKPKIRAGAKVTFEDEKGKQLRGVVKTIEDDTIVVKTARGDEYELDASEVTLA